MRHFGHVRKVENNVLIFLKIPERALMSFWTRFKLVIPVRTHLKDAVHHYEQHPSQQIHMKRCVLIICSLRRCRKATRNFLFCWIFLEISQFTLGEWVLRFKMLWQALDALLNEIYIGIFSPKHVLRFALDFWLSWLHRGWQTWEKVFSGYKFVFRNFQMFAIKKVMHF